MPVPVTVDQAWSRVSDVPFVASCLPGLDPTTLRQEGEHTFRATMVNSVMGIDANWDLRATFEPHEAERKLLVRLDGTDARLHMSLNGNATVLVQPSETGQSANLDYDAKVRVDGSLAAMGGPIIRSIMTDTLGQFVAGVGGQPVDTVSLSWWRKIIAALKRLWSLRHRRGN